MRTEYRPTIRECFGGRQASQASQIDLLPRQVVLQGNQALLLLERFHLAAVDIDLGEKPNTPRLRSGLQERVGCIELRPR